MKITLVTAFSDFLGHDFNSTEEFLKQIPDEKGIIKQILPVGYFKNDFIKPIEKYKPHRIVFLGMHDSRKIPKFEVVAKNQKVTLKNSFHRYFLTVYSRYLKWNNKNLRVNKTIPKEKLTLIPIQKNKPRQISLNSKPPKLKHIEISNDAGAYVCNYSMWVVENYIKNNNLTVEFFFIHLPPKLTKIQKKELLKFILDGRRD